MPPELREQQNNQLGKTFMPYTQSNYRWDCEIFSVYEIFSWIRMHPMGGADGQPGRFKTLDEITCFKCGDTGHFANKCPKGHLAFLSNNQNKKWTLGPMLYRIILHPRENTSSINHHCLITTWSYSVRIVAADGDYFIFILITII